MSKPIASTIVAGVVGDGIISWDSRITEIDSEFHMSTPWVTSQVTLRDMFCHRRGLPEHCGDLLEDLGFDQDDVLHRLRFMNPASSFRSTYAYTIFGLTAAAVAAATAAGTVWEELAARRLYEPLGMEQTSSRYADFKVVPSWRRSASVRPRSHWPTGGATRADRFGPRSVASLLSGMAAGPDFAPYRDALPVLGVDDTEWMSLPATSPALGKIVANSETTIDGDLMNGNISCSARRAPAT
jgi:CubicO group peptidase (beta-lactamase class C family)